jgi:hypothetical protein
MLKINEYDDEDFMISQTMQEIITFQPLITDQAQLIKIISDQLGNNIEGVYINITSPLITVDSDFNTLYIVINQEFRTKYKKR